MYDAASFGASKLAGTSSFGMSGVNAHAILRTPSADGATEAEPTSWQRARYYALPKQFAISATARLARDHSMVFVADLMTAGLAALHDMHLYQSHCLHPTILIELSTASSKYLQGDQNQAMDSISMERTVLGTALQWSSQLSCIVNTRTGDVIVSTDKFSQKLAASVGIAVSRRGLPGGQAGSVLASITTQAFKASPRASEALGSLAGQDVMDHQAYACCPTLLAAAWDLDLAEGQPFKSPAAIGCLLIGDAQPRSSAFACTDSSSVAVTATSSSTVCRSEDITWRSSSVDTGLLQKTERPDVLFGVEWQVENVYALQRRKGTMLPLSLSLFASFLVPIMYTGR